MHSSFGAPGSSLTNIFTIVIFVFTFLDFVLTIILMIFSFAVAAPIALCVLMGLFMGNFETL